MCIDTWCRWYYDLDGSEKGLSFRDGRGDRVVLRHPCYSVLVTLSIVLNVAVRYSIFRKFELEHTFLIHAKGKCKMSAVNRLIKLLRETPNTYTDYLKRAIIETILGASDEKLLNYIHTMLNAAITAEKQQADS